MRWNKLTFLDNLRHDTVAFKFVDKINRKYDTCSLFACRINLKWSPEQFMVEVA